jgi:hypothetical protein
MNGTESYLLLALGRSYIDDCLDLVETLRHFGDTRPINVVVLPQDKEYALSKKIFENTIVFEPEQHPLYPKCSTKFEKFCLLPRLELYDFLITDYTIVLDTDVLCSYYTTGVWNFCKNKNQDLIMLGSINNPQWHWGHWGSVCSKINIKPQETHGGFFFLKKTDQLQKIFLDVTYSFLNYDKLGMLRLYQNGAVDEPCFSYAFSKNDLIPIEFGEFPIMTFNLGYLSEIPTKDMTEQFQARVFSESFSYIPFIHMFEKNHGMNFKLLKHKILQYKS